MVNCTLTGLYTNWTFLMALLYVTNFLLHVFVVLKARLSITIALHGVSL